MIVASKQDEISLIIEPCRKSLLGSSGLRVRHRCRYTLTLLLRRLHASHATGATFERFDRAFAVDVCFSGSIRSRYRIFEHPLHQVSRRRGIRLSGFFIGDGDISAIPFPCNRCTCISLLAPVCSYQGHEILYTNPANQSSHVYRTALE